MSSSTEISNLAISHIGIGKEIQNLATEQSQEATACRRYYEVARKACLRDFDWPFASKIATLALIAENPNTEWRYSYRYPSDAIRIRRILSGVRNDTRQSRVPYKISNDSLGKILFCDEPTASLEYTSDISDPSFYPEDFIIALSFRLAFYITPRLSGGDPFNAQQKMAALYDAEISKAHASALNEEQADEEPRSEFERTRDGYDRFDYDRRRT